MDGRLGAHSVCRRSRFLYAIMVGQGASEIRDTLRRTDRPGCRFSRIDRDQFLCIRRCAGSVPDDAFTCGRLTVGPVLVRVCGASKICWQAKSGGWTLWPCDFGFRRSQWILNDTSRNCACIFSRQADHLGVEVRNEDVWFHFVLSAVGRFFLLRIWPSEVA